MGLGSTPNPNLPKKILNIFIPIIRNINTLDSVTSFNKWFDLNSNITLRNNIELFKSYIFAYLLQKRLHSFMVSQFSSLNNLKNPKILSFYNSK